MSENDRHWFDLYSDKPLLLTMLSENLVDSENGLQVEGLEDAPGSALEGRRPRRLARTWWRRYAS